jgi:hypothetical protein
MDKIIAQRGDYCLLTTQGYAEVMESAHYLPASLAGWAPESDHVVGYIEGDTVYRLVDEPVWLDMLTAYRQRMLNNVMDDLRERGLFEDDEPRGSDLYD